MKTKDKELVIQIVQMHLNINYEMAKSIVESEVRSGNINDYLATFGIIWENSEFLGEPL